MGGQQGQQDGRQPHRPVVHRPDVVGVCKLQWAMVVGLRVFVMVVHDERKEAVSTSLGLMQENMA